MGQHEVMQYIRLFHVPADKDFKVAEKVINDALFAVNELPLSTTLMERQNGSIVVAVVSSTGPLVVAIGGGYTLSRTDVRV